MNEKEHKTIYSLFRSKLTMFSSATALSVGLAASAVADDTYRFKLQEQPLVDAIVKFSEITGIVVTVPSEFLEGRSAPALTYDMPAKQALTLMLEGTGLEVLTRENGGIIVRAPAHGNTSNFQNISMSLTESEADYYVGNLGVYEGDREDDEALVSFDEIVVTASRRSESLQNVGMAVTSVNPDSFVAKGLTSIEDIIDFTPGVNFNAGGVTGFGQITMRGASQEGGTPIVGVYLDDVPFTTGSALSSGTLFLFDGLLGDVERVEIVKGPQGTLYGAGAVGGVVKYITKDPSLDEVRGNAAVDFSTTKEGGFSQLYKGNISLPLLEDRIGLTVSAFYNDESGFIDRVDGTGAVLAEDVDDAETYGVSAKLLWNISDSAEIKLGAMRYETKNSAFGKASYIMPGYGVVAADADPVPEFGLYENDTPPEPQSLVFEKLDATFTYDFEWAQFTSVTAYASYENDSVRDVTSSLGAFTDQLTGSAPGTHSEVLFNRVAASEKIMQEFRLASPNNESLEWQVGMFYVNEDTDSQQVIVPPPSNFNWLTGTFPTEYEELAFFGNVTYYITPKFDVTAGMRHADNSLTLDYDFSGQLVAAQVEEGITEDKVTTYLFSSRYRPNDNLSLYARVASGYRPGFVALPLVDGNGNAIDPLVDSDTLWSYEIGAKGNILDGRIVYDMAVWKIDWNNFQAGIRINNVNGSQNARSGISAHGVEGSIQFNFVDNLAVQTAFTYSRGKLDEDDEGLGGLKGEQSRSMPKWTASVKADYDFALGSWDASIGAGLRYVGKYNTQYLGGTGIFAALAPNLMVPEVVLANVNLGFTKGAYGISLYADNIFDNYAFTGGGDDDITLVRPRTIGVNLSVKY